MKDTIHICLSNRKYNLCIVITFQNELHRACSKVQLSDKNKKITCILYHKGGLYYSTKKNSTHKSSKMNQEHLIDATFVEGHGENEHRSERAYW